MSEENSYCIYLERQIRRILYLSNYRIIDINVYNVETCEELIEMADSNSIDILILVPTKYSEYQKKAAQLIYDNYPDTLMIFILRKDSDIFFLLRYFPFNVVRKTKFESDLSEGIRAALRRIISSTEYISIRKHSSITNLQIKRIRYICRNKNDVIFYTKDGEYKVRTKLSNFDLELLKHDFLRIKSGVLVNMQEIEKIGPYKVHILGGEVLLISRKHYYEVLTKYEDYQKEKNNSIIITKKPTRNPDE